MAKFLDLAGLAYFWGKIKSYVADYHSNHLPSVGDKALKFKTHNGTATVITTNEGTNDKTLEINGDGTWITSGALDLTTSNTVKATFSHAAPDSSSITSRTYTSSTGNYAFGTEYTVIATAALDADDKGHVNIGTNSTNPGLKLTKQKIKDTNRAIKVDGNEKLPATVNTAVDFVDGTGTDAVWTPTGSKIQYNLKKATTSTLGGIIASNALNSAVTLTSGDGSTANRYYGVQVDSNGVAFVNVPWPNLVSALDSKLKVAADSGTTAQVFSANAENDSTVTITGGTDLNTSVNGTTLTVNHDTMNSTASPMETTPAAGNTTLLIGSNKVLSSISFAHTNGHITSITPTFKEVKYATESTPGLMSIEDKKTLNQINLTIANALTSAITPKGSVTADWIAAGLDENQNPILGSSHVGDLYQLSSPLVIGEPQSGDVTTSYTNFVEGSSITNNGTERHEFPAGTYVMVVNTGTALNPVYKYDAVSGLYDMSDYWTNDDLKPIPLDTSDSNYDGPTTTVDPTIDSICV